MVMIILIGSSVAVALALYALSKNINLYYTPTQIANQQAPIETSFRIGGLIKSNSIFFDKKGLTVSFILTDKIHNVPILYTGILPDLFRAGQGVVAQGRLNAKGIFIADQVLAKHSANYMPPAVADALRQGKSVKK
jgi:cytochrome c-type biogenesis protein CcmE